MIDETRWELDYQIIKRALPNPGKYMQAYCSMTANVYSVVHWGIYNTKKPKSCLISYFSFLDKS